MNIVPNVPKARDNKREEVIPPDSKEVSTWKSLDRQSELASMGKLGLGRLAEEGWDCESQGALEDSLGSKVLAFFVGGLQGGICGGATDVADALLVWYLLWGAESGKCEGASSGARTGAALWLLWGAVVDPPRVLGMMKRWNEAQRFGIREGRDGKAKIFAQGRGVCASFSHRGGGVCDFRTPQGGVRNFRTGYYSPARLKNCGLFEMVKICGLWGWEKLA